MLRLCAGLARPLRYSHIRTCSLSASYHSDDQTQLVKVHAGLRELREILDTHVIGHKDVKEALLLGLLSREHVYIEGPPGVAKTMLSEVVSSSVALKYWFYQMHRDVRLSELVGESVITKETSRSGGEVIKQDIIKGGVLSCEIAVLDDISRAPGQALNVLLRILNERKFGDEQIPLVSAIATSNPAAEDGYYAEPLDPATLDRFTLQLRSYGLINNNDWSQAEQVIDLFAGPRSSDNVRHIKKVNQSLVSSAGQLTPLVVLGDYAKTKLVRLLQVLRNDYNCTEENSLLTDRTFLAKAVTVLKANAVLHGRFVCEPKDLYVLRFMTTFRVPEEVHAKIEEIVSQVLSEDPRPPQEPVPPPPEGGDGQGDEDDSPTEAGNTSKDESGESTTNASSEDTESHDISADDELDPEVSDKPKRDTDKSKADASAEKEATNQDEDAQESDDQKDNEGGKGMGVAETHAASVNNLDDLMKRLGGRLEDGYSNEKRCPGGVPRSWVECSDFASLGHDANTSDMSLWLDYPSPQLPRVQLRTRKSSGGRVAILRDASTSMAGIWNNWASSLSLQFIRLAEQKSMRVGYIEFSDTTNTFAAGRKGNFFTREYRALRERAEAVDCCGLTNYELPLTIALNEFEKMRHMQMLNRGASNDQHIVFVTDGQPTSGDRLLSKVVRQAQELGVSVHTIFIGCTRSPIVLDRLSRETKGLQYTAYLDQSTQSIQVVDRTKVDVTDLMANQMHTPISPEQMNLMSKFPTAFRRYLDVNQLDRSDTYI